MGVIKKISNDIISKSHIILWIFQFPVQQSVTTKVLLMVIKWSN